MTIIRIFIKDEFLIDNNWVLLNGQTELGSGVGTLAEITAMEYEHLEIYLAPHLSTIFKVDIEHISDRKISDELLLGLVEDQLVEELDECKPLLMRLSDGQAYIAVLMAEFYSQMIAGLKEHVKLVKFIQPLPFATEYTDGQWTLYLTNEYKFIRTSMFEYFLLDDAKPIPDVLDVLLQSFDIKLLKIYSDDESLVSYLEENYDLKCQLVDELVYGNLVWNFYNEKSKRFNLKLDSSHKNNLIKLGRSVAVLMIVSLFFWIVNLSYLVVAKYKLQSQITKDLSGIMRVDSYQPTLLAKVNDQLNAIYHTKNLYASNDYVSLFDVFLRSMPDINQHMIVGTKFSNGVLEVFLNSQFSNNNFANDHEVLLSKRILADIDSYQNYQAKNSDNQNNNGGGLLDSNNTTTAQQMTDATWVITLQAVTRLDELNDVSNSKK